MLPLFCANKLLLLRHVRTGLFLPAMSRQKSFGVNYYRDKSFWLTRKLRKLFMRFPNLENIVVATLLISVVAIPFIIKRNQLLKMRRELTDDEWADYKQTHNAVITNRRKYGQNLYIPFYNNDRAVKQDEKAKETFMDS